MTDKEKIQELLELTGEREHNRTRTVLPIAFIFAAVFWIVASFLGRQEHSIFLYITAVLAMGALFYQIRENRKHKLRIKQLKLELGVN